VTATRAFPELSKETLTDGDLNVFTDPGEVTCATATGSGVDAEAGEWVSREVA